MADLDEGNLLNTRTLRLFFTLALILGVCLPVPVLQARVFQRLGWGTSGSLFNVEAFGKKLYQTVMNVNGARADVTVAMCDGGMDGVRQSLAASAGKPMRFSSGPGIGVGEITGAGRTVRLIALAPAGSTSPGLIVAVEQADGERHAAHSTQLQHGIPEVPLFPGSRVSSFMRNEDTRVAWEVALSPVLPEGIMAFYRSTLKQAGWEQPFSVGASESGGMLLFMKGRDVCCIQTQRTDSDSETRVTLLHKRGALD